MRSLHLWLALIVGWMFVVGGAGGLSASTPVSPAGAGCALAVAVAMLAAPRLARFPFVRIALLSAVLLVLFRIASGDPMLGEHLPQSAVDLLAVLVTAALSVRAAGNVNAFNRAVSRLMLAGLRGRPRPLVKVQADLHRELHRARRGRQSLTVLALSAAPQGGASLQDRLIEESLRSLAGKCVQAQVAGLLRDEAAQCDTVARFDQHLVAVLPCTPREEAAEVVSRLREVAKRKLGVELAVGRASFPDEEITLVGLVERAQADMRSQIAHRPAPPTPEAAEGGSVRGATVEAGTTSRGANGSTNGRDPAGVAVTKEEGTQ